MHNDEHNDEHDVILPLVAALAVFVATTARGTIRAQPCGIAPTSGAAPLYPLPEGEQWGFIGPDGEWRLAPQWRQVRPFSEGSLRSRRPMAAD